MLPSARAFCRFLRSHRHVHITDVCTTWFECVCVCVIVFGRRAILAVMFSETVSNYGRLYAAHVVTIRVLRFKPSHTSLRIVFKCYNTYSYTLGIVSQHAPCPTSPTSNVCAVKWISRAPPADEDCAADDDDFSYCAVGSSVCAWRMSGSGLI